MKSIRVYLLLMLLATLALVMFMSLLKGYQSSLDVANKLFDERLMATAELLATSNTTNSPTKPHDNQPAEYLFFQIWDENLQLLTHSKQAPTEALSPFEQGFYDVNFASYRWHNYVFFDDSLSRWIIVGERSDVRRAMGENIVLAAVFPSVVGICISALLIWWLIGNGLKPLKQLSRQLVNKQADDLTPVKLEKLPVELDQLVSIINQLFWRLDQTFQREQRFAADAAHELRTPISALQVHLHNLQLSADTHQEDWRLMEQSVARMGHMVNQILMLYRTSPEQIHAKAEKIDLFKLARRIIADEFQQFDSRQQQVGLQGETALIEGHDFAMETLLQNLLANASKYTPDGGQIQVDIHPVASGVVLTVEDSGPGIPAEQYARVFDRFYRLQSQQASTEVVGCGLGLAIVKHIVDIHRADIKLGKSETLSGLKISIHFPVALSS
ncbi:ATP-binding protein [Methylophaga sp. OBS3]|uniref:sensor histidine kinase n=1 Tax=Methylophaga sp. OBS3 TaxID=2991934 RepID=UPI00225B2C1E|nr:ATP-binding protein [Methylophaga sp. OBS3]MCX4189628.1 ATP-binding protein [Methylophaga sp. OBS3]